MDDRLEKFIKDHRAKLDYKTPRQEVWETIASEINRQPRQKVRSIKPLVIWRAAAVILLLVTSILVYDRINLVSRSAQPAVVLNQELQQVESYYLAEISDRRSEVLALSEQLNTGNGFVQDLNSLDSLYQALKQEIPQGNEESIMDAMIQNLQWRIEILNKQLDVLRSIEQSKKLNNKSNETISL